MSKRRSKKETDDELVIIKPNAYYKMLVHVLRFGNKVRDPRKFKEVMGILIGHLEDSKVIVEDAVPISHGGSIEVAFSMEDYPTFAKIDEEAFSQGKHSVGWYHSHPGLQIFWSSTDVQNQLFWQTDQNPHGIGIVFDHTYLDNEGDLGFRTFKLEDHEKGMKSGYYEVKTIVEPPDSVEYYSKLMDLINKIHAKEPLILEINETPDPFGEIYFPDQNEILVKKPEINTDILITNLKEGILQFLDFSINPLAELLNKWSQKIVKNIMDNNVQMRKDLITLKDNLTQGIHQIQNKVKNIIKDQLNEVDLFIDDKFEIFDAQQEENKNKLNSLKKEVIQHLETLFQEELNKSITSISDFFEAAVKDISDLNQKAINNEENLNKNQESMRDLAEKISSLENTAIVEVKNLQERLNKSFFEKVHNFTTDLSSLKEQVNDYSSKFEELTSNLKDSKDMINKKIKSIESEKKELLNEMKKLKNKRD
ncbi:MAG: hypothetical protein EU539_07065 [Promethearchaeota archaeon]|nr:MAG: hypothetical protein EU539_07065 [Candidatus Lokiarchaeota archaeon]